MWHLFFIYIFPVGLFLAAYIIIWLILGGSINMAATKIDAIRAPLTSWVSIGFFMPILHGIISCTILSPSVVGDNPNKLFGHPVVLMCAILSALIGNVLLQKSFLDSHRKNPTFKKSLKYSILPLTLAALFGGVVLTSLAIHILTV
jgi:hypothetical protein